MNFIRLLLGFTLLCCISNPLIAQSDLTDDGNSKNVSYTGSVQDFTIPYNSEYNSINFSLTGGDGGRAKKGACESYGGDGATVTGTLIIGDYGGQLSPGTVLRFIVGSHGDDDEDGIQIGWRGAGGGGGSALLAEIDGTWEILAVAGGGGGAYQGASGFCINSESGQGGRTSTDGGDGGGSLSGDGGSNGEGGDGGGGLGSGDLAGGGGGAFSSGSGTFSKEGKAGYPDGGSGGSVPSEQGGNGGWGFGGGGAGEEAGGGGGGYSGGGGGGTTNNGGGGGSYVNDDYVVNKSLTAGGSSSPTQWTAATYQFTDICIANVTGFVYENAICEANDLGRIQLDYTVLGGNVCNNSFDFALLPADGSSHLGNGVIRSVRAGDYTVEVKNTILDEVISTTPITIGINTDIPVAKCKNIAVNLVNGSYSNNDLAALLDNGSTGFCDLVFSASRSRFDCDDIGIQIVTLTVTNSQGLSSSCEAGVTVLVDAAEEPIARCQGTQTMNLMGGTVDISVEDIDNGSTFGTCTSAMSVSPSSFDCDDIGPQTVTLTVGTADNNASCTSTIIFVDNGSPTALCQETIVKGLDANGGVTLTVAEVDNGSNSNNCTDLSYSLSQSIFDCDNAGLNTLTLTVTDGNGKTSSCTSNLTIQDNSRPVPICQDITISLDENGTYTLDPVELDNGSSDNCSISSFTASQTDFDCDDLGTTTAVTLYVRDHIGVESTCTANVTVTDDLPPTASCLDLSFNMTGNGFGIGNYLNQFLSRSSDNCGIVSRSFSESGFDCSDIGENEVVFQVIDAAGNTDECTFTVTFTETGAPAVVCQDISVELDANGNATITPDMVDNGTTDACSDFSLSLSKTNFDCGDIGNENTVVLTATDTYNNSATCEATVTVLDLLPPVPTCPNYIYIPLRNQEVYEFGNDQYSQLNNNVNSNCFPYSIKVVEGVTSYDCDDVGSDFEITVEWKDASKNTSYCTTTVQIRDPLGVCNTAPTALCQDITVAVDDNCEASISASQVNGGSSDPDGDPISFDVDNSGSFGLGTHQVILTVSDGKLSSSCNATVTVEDQTPPVAICEDLTLELDEYGETYTTRAELLINSYDNCGLESSFNQFYSFECSEVGKVNRITLKIRDESNNESECTSTITVVDVTPPTVLCENYTLVLNKNGNASLPVWLVSRFDSDNCTVISTSLSTSTFDCSSIGDQTVVVTAVDPSGNSSTCESIVTVSDISPPDALCQDITVALDDKGEAVAVATDVDNGSTDACGIASLTLDQTNFNCSDVGNQNTVTLTVTDNYGNSASCESTVYVVDNIAPTAVCQDVSIQIGDNQLASITPAMIDNGSSDNCSITSLAIVEGTSLYDCSNAGNTLDVILQVTDIAGLSSTCTATVTVIDEIDPSLTCPGDQIVNTDPGECGAYVTLPKAAPADNCGIKNLKSRYRALDETGSPTGSWSSWESDHSGFFELGSYEIQWRAKDNSNNKGFCSYQLNVIDEEAPEVICKDVSIHLNGEETIAIEAFSIFDEVASFDACGTVAFASQSITEVSCDEVGETLAVQVIGVDPNGNSAACTAQVTVEGMPCGFVATDIDCEDGASAHYDPVEDSYTLTADDCSGYPRGEYSLVKTELCGDGEIIAQVSNLSSNARAGLIMMESASSDTRFVSIVKDLTRRVRTEFRTSTGGNIYSRHKNHSSVEWLRIIKEGSKFKTFTSRDGISWRLVHIITYSNFEECIYVGLVVYSKDTYTPATAVFKQVKVIGDTYSSRTTSSNPSTTVIESLSETELETGLQTNDLQLNVAPNPFADQTQITFNLPRATEVTLEIYNLHGQRVQSLENGRLAAGTHRYAWEGQSSKGESLPTGIYMLRLRVDKKWVTTKVSLVNR